MKLPLRLSRSRSSSPPSSTPSSPLDTPSISPTTAKNKHRFGLPIIGSGHRASKKTAVGNVSSPLPAHDTGKSPQPNERSSTAVPSVVPETATSTTSRVTVDDRRLEIEQAFAQFDANGDGRISTKELQAVLLSLGEETTIEEAAQMLREGDADGDGFIDLEEFVEMNKRCTVQLTEEEEIVAAFAIFDIENTGRITAEGLQQVLQRLGGSLAECASAEECRRMISGADCKGAGHLDFEDFKRIMVPLIF